MGMTPPDMGVAPDMGDPDMGGAPDMGEPNMEEPDMGGAPDMEEPDNGGEEDDELMNVVNGLSMEDKVAVLKYAKSLGDDYPDNKEDNQFNESVRRNRNAIVNEIVNDIFNRRDGEKKTNREEKFIDNDEVSRNNPFVGNR